MVETKRQDIPGDGGAYGALKRKQKWPATRQNTQSYSKTKEEHSMNKRIGSILRRGQRGFTLIELVAVMAILAVLAALVGGAVGGMGATGQNARLAGDTDTLGKAADRFFNDSFPQTYPVVSLANTDASIIPVSETLGSVDFGIRLLDFDARLPQDPTKVFVPDFIKDIPATAALVSWRVDTATGQVFFTQDGAVLARPSGSRFSVSAGSTALSAHPNYTFTQAWKKGGAAQVEMSVEIPAGYSIGGQSLAANTQVGTFTTQFYTDNPWDPGQPINYGAVVTTDSVLAGSGVVYATGQANEWVAKIDLGEETLRVYTISITMPSSDTPGKITIVTDRTGVWDAVSHPDTDFEESSGTWVLTIDGVVSGTNIITNPGTKGVYRWLTKEHTATDVPDFFNDVAGNQSVVIK